MLKLPLPTKFGFPIAYSLLGLAVLAASFILGLSIDHHKPKVVAIWGDISKLTPADLRSKLGTSKTAIDGSQLGLSGADCWAYYQGISPVDGLVIICIPITK